MTERATDDLFRHVNGEWLDTYVIPDDRAGDGQMRQLHDHAEIAVRDIITGLGGGEAADEKGGELAGEEEIQKVTDLYASFMDTDTIDARGIDPLISHFERITTAQTHDQLAAITGSLYRTGTGGLIAGFVSADAKDSDTYALYTAQSGITLPDEAYYREDQYAEIRTKFTEHITRLATLAGLDTYTLISNAELGAKVLELETAFASHHWDRVTNRDAQKTYNPVSRSELVKLSDGFAITAWLDAAGINPSLDHIIVAQPSALTGLAEEWAQANLADLKAWLIYRVLTAKTGALPQAIVDEHFDFHSRTLSGTPHIRERWKRGVSLVEGLLGETVGKLYVDQFFPPESKAAIQELVDALIAAYRQSITELTWMSEDTKVKALDKLDKFTPKVGYPDKWREYRFTVDATDLAGNIDRAEEAEADRQFGRIGSPIDPDEWLMTPQTVNAYYHPVLNEIVFPAAILQPPFFDPDGSTAANFGAIGAVIGHEIGHGFDDQGSRYDGEGNLVNWWTDDDRARFTERAEALIKQYDGLVPAGLDPTDTVNGALTIGENIGDLGGLGIAWKAFKLATGADEDSEVNHEDAKAFFTSWATAWQAKFRPEERRRRLAVDPHAPEEFRCNQVVKNMDAFHTTYGTTPGDAMWLAPDKRVTIW